MQGIKNNNRPGKETPRTDLEAVVCKVYRKEDG